MVFDCRVCKRWSHIVKRLKKTRHKPVWLMYDSGNETGSFVDEQIGSKLKVGTFNFQIKLDLIN